MNNGQDQISPAPMYWLMPIGLFLGLHLVETAVATAADGLDKERVVLDSKQFKEHHAAIHQPSLRRGPDVYPSTVAELQQYFPEIHTQLLGDAVPTKPLWDEPTRQMLKAWLPCRSTKTGCGGVGPARSVDRAEDTVGVVLCLLFEIVSYVLSIYLWNS